MIVSNNSFWLFGKPDSILTALALLANKHSYVREVISANIQLTRKRIVNRHP
jgi:hypothetical protein